MNKNRGFTLVELVLSIALLTFIIVVSSSLYDRAFKITPELRKSTTNIVKASSLIENNIQMARDFSYLYIEHKDNKDGIPDEILEKQGYKKTDYKEPEKLRFRSSDGENIIKIGNKPIKDIKGYYLSVKGDEFEGINNISSDNTLFTIIGLGSFPPEISRIGEFFIKQPSQKYMYLEKLGEQYQVGYNLEEKNKKIFHMIAARGLISPISLNNVICLPYVDTLPYGMPGILSDTSFALAGKEVKSKNPNGILNFNTKPEEISVKEDLSGRTIAATAKTQNKNGLESVSKNTLSDEKGRTYIHCVGLPVTDNILGYYDANLAVSKGTNDNKYYSVFDENNQASMEYRDLLQSAKDGKYPFEWQRGIDVRKMTGLGSESSQYIEMPTGFLQQVERNVGIEGDKKEKKLVPNANKAYGNSIYYNTKDNPLKLEGKNGWRTFIIKYNTKNYNREFKDIATENASFPYALISHNLDLKTGLPVNRSRRGFAIYADKDGNLYKYNIIIEEVPTDEGVKYEHHVKNDSLNYNIFDQNLYNDDKFKFDTLYNEKPVDGIRDGREDYNMVAIKIFKSGSSFGVYVYKIEKSLSSDEKISLGASLIFNTLELQGCDEINNVFRLMEPIDSIVIDIDGNKEQFEIYEGTELVVEISDALYYDMDLDTGKINEVANYLYKKFLTARERGIEE